MIDSIIFDVDGTLLDSRAQVRLAWGDVILQLTGKPLTMSDDAFTALFGLPMDEIAKRLFPHVTDPQQRLAMADRCYQAENDLLWTHPGRLYPHVPRVLQQLAARFPLYIVSNCQTGYIQAALQPQGILPLFSDWLCFGDTGTPKSVTIQTLCQRHGLQHPIYVGDTSGDQTACRDAGIPFVYAAYGFGSVTDPAYTIHSFHDLLSLSEVTDIHAL